MTALERKSLELSSRSTAEDFAVAWLLGYGPSTREAYARDARSFFSWCKTLGVDPLEVRRVHVDAYVRESTEICGLAASTVARRLAAMSSFYAYVGDEIGIPNPCARVRRPRAEVPRGPGLSREEVSALLEAAEAEGPRSAALVGLLLFNGLRVSEACALRIEDLRRERGRVVVRIVGKGGRVAEAPLASWTADRVRHLMKGRDEGPVLATSAGRALDRIGAYRAVKRIGEAADITGLHPHRLRHAFVTLALDSGVSLRDVQDSARHLDPRTTRRYDDARGSLDRHPAERLIAYLLAPGATEGVSEERRSL